MEPENIYSLISNICNNNYKPGELVEFINISQQIATSYLKYQEVIGKNIRPKKAEGINEIEDVAIDCIAGLFMRNNTGDYVQLKRYFTPILNTPPTNNEETLMMLRRLIVKKTKQELSRIFRERDPESAKILRNIRVTIRNSDQYISIKENGREFVGLKLESNTPLKIPQKLNETIDTLLYNQFLDIYCPGDSVSKMMKKLLNITNHNSDKHHLLSIDQIANIIREVTFHEFKRQFTNNIDHATPFNELQMQEVTTVNNLIIKQIQKKIDVQYFKKNKLDQEKANIYSLAICDFVQDLTNAKKCESNYKYLKKYIPTLTQQMYREDERSIFEYLIKVTKKSLRKKLKELL